MQEAELRRQQAEREQAQLRQQREQKLRAQQEAARLAEQQRKAAEEHQRQLHLEQQHQQQLRLEQERRTAELKAQQEAEEARRRLQINSCEEIDQSKVSQTGTVYWAHRASIWQSTPRSNRPRKLSPSRQAHAAVYFTAMLSEFYMIAQQRTVWTQGGSQVAG